MKFLVVATSQTTVTLWDQETRDRRGDPAGLTELTIGEHTFRENDLVNFKLVYAGRKEGASE